MPIPFPVQLLVSTPSGPLPLTPERARLPLPRGPESQGPLMTYGAYLRALSQFLAQDSFGPLLSSLTMQLGRPVNPANIVNLEVISEKHGVLYHVAHLRVHLKEEISSLVMNVAATPEQQAFLEEEFKLLEELYRRFELPYLPRPFLQGETVYTGEDGSRRTLKLFLGEWFEGFHEFHLSSLAGEAPPAIKVWGLEEGDTLLDAEQTRALYHQASAILTAYLDTDTFRQIYPWHHAAGDFILKQGEKGIELRLITARDYRALISPGSAPEDKWIAIVHFFLNLTLRMRLDRLEGTGESAWAPPECLRGVLSGFLESWSRKAQRDSSLPSAQDVLFLLRQFSPDEWQSLGEVILEGALVEADEIHFLGPRLEKHVSDLVRILAEEDPT